MLTMVIVQIMIMSYVASHPTPLRCVAPPNIVLKYYINGLSGRADDAPEEPRP